MPTFTISNFEVTEGVFSILLILQNSISRGVVVKCINKL